MGKARRARVVSTATAMTAVPIGGMIGVVAAKEEAEASVARAKSRRAELTQAIGLQRIVLLVVMTVVVALAALERGVEAVTEGDSVIEMVVTDDPENATEMRARPEETTTGALVRDRTSTTATVIVIVVVTVVVTVIEMTVVLAVAASETELKMMTPAAGVTVSPVGTTVIGGMMVLQWKERGSS